MGETQKTPVDNSVDLHLRETDKWRWKVRLEALPGLGPFLCMEPGSSGLKLFPEGKLGTERDRRPQWIIQWTPHLRNGQVEMARYMPCGGAR